jgi:hypothetical protein
MWGEENERNKKAATHSGVKGHQPAYYYSSNLTITPFHEGICQYKIGKSPGL